VFIFISYSNFCYWTIAKPRIFYIENFFYFIIAYFLPVICDNVIALKWKYTFVVEIVVVEPLKDVAVLATLAELLEAIAIELVEFAAAMEPPTTVEPTDGSLLTVEPLEAPTIVKPPGDPVIVEPLWIPATVKIEGAPLRVLIFVEINPVEAIFDAAVDVPLIMEGVLVPAGADFAASWGDVLSTDSTVSPIESEFVSRAFSDADDVVSSFDPETIAWPPSFDLEIIAFKMVVSPYSPLFSETTVSPAPRVWYFLGWPLPIVTLGTFFDLALEFALLVEFGLFFKIVFQQDFLPQHWTSLASVFLPYARNPGWRGTWTLLDCNVYSLFSKFLFFLWFLHSTESYGKQINKLLK